MATVTKAMLVQENEQLRALLAQEIGLREQWECEARRARRDIVRLRSGGGSAQSTQQASFAELARQYCAKHGVASCSKAEALSMATSA